ncbi:alpha/beta-hydrolase [Anaeromyces robustus]|uniref:Alpha/beta-hydrolase n=1 Tax=Anaeromyces robustus TaxID=1754192 RepID=A0A1Y1VVL8_9FUNG|nr:alpha/beta-hydrolase [Anaeromyces robustus]|eukprot:ORX65055.1 alpha/beta-hydrolase [Anaeromyces robustus]
MKRLVLNIFIIFLALLASNIVDAVKECKIREPELVKDTIKYSDHGDLDVYYDKSLLKRKRPVIIHVHGGGWCEGSKDKEGYMGSFFQETGYVSVLLNYRLYPETENIDDMVEDIYTGLKWVKKNIRKYGGDVNKMTLMGHSAGAHLATLTNVKAALKMTVNDKKLKPFHFKHLISLNGRHSIDEGEALQAGIDQLYQLSSVPGLSFLALYAEAREHLLIGKSGFDQVKILKNYKDKSINFLGAERYTFVECDEDTVDPMGLADPMIEQIKRTVKDVIIDHKIFHGDHQYMLDGVMNNDEKREKELLEIIEPELVKNTVKYSKHGDLDIYYDNTLLKKKRPVIIHVHGGGWCEGSKDKEAYMGSFFQKKGYISVLLNYRLYPETENIDDMVEDIYTALKWIKTNISLYGGDSDQMTLMGHSAGAHLATLTNVKAALKMTVNDKKLKPFHFKHLISLNGRHSIDEGEALQADIDQLYQLSHIPGLSFLALYAEAREHLLIGKSGFDQVKILKNYEDESIKSLGAEKYTFVECDEDTVDPMGLADPMIEQIKRTVRKVTVDHKIFHGDHQYMLDGVMNNDEKRENELLEIVESVY